MLIIQDHFRKNRDEPVSPRRSVRHVNWPDFNIRPISEEWMYFGRDPAYKTATANAAYVWRDSSPVDRHGPMPRRFAERRCELKGSGLALPANAPLWAATDPYRIWAEADAATAETGDPTAVSAWHVVMQIPTPIRRNNWRWLVEGFIQTELVVKGAAVAWAIHSLEGDGSQNDWIISPHAHLIVTALHWRHEKRHGQRHPFWIASWAQQKRMEFAWRRRCVSARDFARLL
ncbi:MobA/MobL family protein [Sphingobium sp. DC-2]|uniref:MobA/MobL family protein n=1 Tax=Sphingobium sp. DC-2 TaxID=1303256 RepID=UPI000689C3A5|nr:MobA/MobL family protein [Sphingobium sp. DC-2]